MTIATVRAKLKERLEQISGLTAYAYPPNMLGKLPCAIVDYEAQTADYEQPGNTTIWRFRVLLLVLAWEADKGFEALDDYLEKTGSKSIKANVENNPSTVGDYCVVQRCENAGPIKYKSGDQVCYGAEFVVEVGDTT